MTLTFKRDRTRVNDLRGNLYHRAFYDIPSCLLSTEASHSENQKGHHRV